jgi:hypothetical protein
MYGAWQFLNNVKASGAKYLLPAVGSHSKSVAANRNIPAGGRSGITSTYLLSNFRTAVLAIVCYKHMYIASE